MGLTETLRHHHDHNTKGREIKGAHGFKEKRETNETLS